MIVVDFSSTYIYHISCINILSAKALGGRRKMGNKLMDDVLREYGRRLYEQERERTERANARMDYERRERERHDYEFGYSIYNRDGEEIRWVPGHGNPDWDSGEE